MYKGGAYAVWVFGIRVESIRVRAYECIRAVYTYSRCIYSAYICVCKLLIHV